MRWCDIDKEGSDIDGIHCWIYEVADGKTSHHGHRTTYVLGPRAQEILAAFPPRSPSAAIFSPAQTMKELGAERRIGRKTKVFPSTLRRDAQAGREFADRYSTETYRQSVERASEKAGVVRFTPHEVRHGFITRAAAQFGAFAAASAANHGRVSTTENYLHRLPGDAGRVVIGLERALAGRIETEAGF